MGLLVPSTSEDLIKILFNWVHFVELWFQFVESLKLLEQLDIWVWKFKRYVIQ